jgi:integrase/recombinase XerD
MSYDIAEVKEYLQTLELDKSKFTIDSYKIAINKFFTYMKIESKENLDCLVASDFRNYQAWLKETGLKASSINAYSRPLKALFNWMVENEYLEKNPMDKVKAMKEKKEMLAFFTEEETSTFLSACDLEEKAMFAIFFSTGLRRNELASLKLSDIDMYTILVSNGKGDKERTVYMPEDVYDVFLDYLEWRNKKYGMEIPYAFVSKARRNYTGESIRMKFKTIMKKAGFSEKRISELHPHSTRHTFCANLIEGGVDLKVAQVALGHADLAITSKIYAHVRNSAVEKAMRNQKSNFAI